VCCNVLHNIRLKHLILRKIRRDIINVHKSSFKVPVTLCRFLSNFNFLNRLFKNPHISNCMKSVKWDHRLPCKNMGGYDEPYSFFWQFCERAWKQTTAFLHALQRVSLGYSLPTLNSLCSRESQNFCPGCKPNDIDGKLLTFFTKIITHILTTCSWQQPNTRLLGAYEYYFVLAMNCGPGWRSLYSDSLLTGRSRDRIPVERGARFSAPVLTLGPI
jgi:hypothetical protein